MTRIGNAIADAVIVGGGFYGTAIAIYLARQRQFKRVLIVEREPSLFMRASYNNQARVHNGYHYPRSLTTAYRSRINAPRFLLDRREAVMRNFTKLYAVARHNSKVTARQFERFCREIGAPLRSADAITHALFEPRLVESVFVAEEYVFDAVRLAQSAERELKECAVDVFFHTQATAIEAGPDGTLRVVVKSGTGTGSDEAIACRTVFNCAYSGLNQFAGDFPGTRTGLKQELAEMALVQLPPALQGLGVTLMDGPFFSSMPFPARDLHTLSHVRYTPHMHWHDATGIDPYRKLADYDRTTRVDRMIRDAGRYLPSMLRAKYVESLFEVKTVLAKNEGDDGRPILFEKHPELPGCYSILGGKIDNIYDVLEKLDAERFAVESA